jgi:predicted NBD/HSP70 family sugar kinase
LAANGHPVATQLLREAGNRTGVVLSSIVNFFNPRRVVLGGTLSEAESFISGVQSAIYTECQPFATDSLEIEATKAKKTGGITGSARLALDRILDPARITAAVNASTRK